MNSEEILRVIVEAKAGRKDYYNQLSIEVDATAASALKAFVAGLDTYNADKLIDDSFG